MEELRKLGELHILHSASCTMDLGFVRFGKKDATSRILFIIKGAGLLDSVAFVEGIDVCLTSVMWFVKARGMNVNFGPDSVDFEYQGRTIIKGHYNETLGMCTLDMLALITAPDPRLPCDNSSPAAMTARKVQRYK